jgi:xanthine/CO dehydrogenase XdhC/CoxF family maturation factor
MNAECDVLEAAGRWRTAGHRVALATVLETWGSAPRQPGSQLAVNDVGDFVGSVSGGCVESAVVEQAKTIMSSGEPVILEFGVSDDQAWEVGLACGGTIQVFVERLG